MYVDSKFGGIIYDVERVPEVHLVVLAAARKLVGPKYPKFGNEITAIRSGKWSNQFSGFGF